MKCNKCSSEWTTGSELSKCPFCGAELTEDVFEGTFEDVPSFLKYVFSKYTVDILKNKIKLLALASDYLSSTGGDFGLLRIAVEAGVYLPFIGIEESDVDAKYSDAVLKLTELHYIGKEHAEKAVSWITKVLFEGKTATAQPAPSPVKASGASAAASTLTPTKQKLTLSDGEYEGETVFGVRHGYGVFTYKNGGKYEGEWNHGKKHGIGTQYNDDGSILYQGEFKNGEYHGYGTYYLDGSILYQGEFKNGEYHGYGTYYLGGSIWYQGDFKDGKYHGFGTWYNDDGSIYYQGEWEDGEPKRK